MRSKIYPPGAQFHYEELKPVASEIPLAEAEIICAVLADQGIPSVIPGEEFSTLFGGLNPSILHGLQVLVPESHLEQAKRVLEEARRIGREENLEDLAENS